eukprot:TRINITY_DN11479_c0_g2_i1.p1 TRINITY_DN11479_c0_g2~~TRINITY_DN11479_c0_g2_i1.p1  ORF type:complete len:109 (+),score=0.04 TRINITY_DN11479_c0_g2_i1:144-470(+)
MYYTVIHNAAIVRYSYICKLGDVLNVFRYNVIFILPMIIPAVKSLALCTCVWEDREVRKPPNSNLQCMRSPLPGPSPSHVRRDVPSPRRQQKSCRKLSAFSCQKDHFL